MSDGDDDSWVGWEGGAGTGVWLDGGRGCWWCCCCCDMLTPTSAPAHDALKPVLFAALTAGMTSTAGVGTARLSQPSSRSGFCCDDEAAPPSLAFGSVAVHNLFGSEPIPVCPGCVSVLGWPGCASGARELCSCASVLGCGSSACAAVPSVEFPVSWAAERARTAAGEAELSASVARAGDLSGAAVAEAGNLSGAAVAEAGAAELSAAAAAGTAGVAELALLGSVEGSSTCGTSCACCASLLLSGREGRKGWVRDFPDRRPDRWRPRLMQDASEALLERALSSSSSCSVSNMVGMCPSFAVASASWKRAWRARHMPWTGIE